MVLFIITNDVVEGITIGVVEYYYYYYHSYVMVLLFVSDMDTTRSVGTDRICILDIPSYTYIIDVLTGCTLDGSNPMYHQCRSDFLPVIYQGRKERLIASI